MQTLDLNETGTQLDWSEIVSLHERKTGALIRASVRCGAWLGRAGAEDLDALTHFDARIGVAFQVADDVLDTTSTAQQLGKTPGKDAAQRKNTAVACLGVEGARTRARELLKEAMAHLDRFGHRAEDLRALAR